MSRPRFSMISISAARIAAPNRFDQPFATRNCRDDQIEGNRQASERPSNVGPSVLIVDVGDDRHRRRPRADP